MKIYLSSVTLILSLFFLACNKDDDNGPTKLLDHYVTTTNPDTTYFGYNSSDQIISVENHVYRYTMDINGNQMNYETFKKSDSRVIVDGTFALNADGNLDSGQATFSANASSPYTSQFTYTYDASGNMISQTNIESTGDTITSEYTWTNGDLTVQRYYINNSLYFTRTYEFSSGQEDKLHLDMDKFLSATNSFVGNPNKHLLTRSYAILAPGPMISQDYHYTNALDADGYLDSLTFAIVNTAFTEVFHYHYQ